MATIVTRAGKGSPLTHDEVDANFDNLNTDKLEISGGSMSGNLSFGDNDKALFGAGSDLQIYHDGSNSYIDDAGTGDLYLRSSNDLLFTNADGSENYARFQENGYARLFYDNSLKFTTTSTGVNVTGTITSDGLTVSNNAAGIADAIELENFTGESSYVKAKRGLTLSADYDNNSSAAQSNITFETDGSEVMRITSIGRVGIGVSSPSGMLHVSGADPEIYLTDTTTGVDHSLDGNSGLGNLYLRVDQNDEGSDSKFLLSVGSASNVIVADAASNVGIGDGSPSARLEVIGGDVDAVSIKSDGHVQLYDNTSSSRAYTFLSRDISNAMVGGNMRLDASVTTGSHIGYSSGTDARGGSGIVFDNTANGSSEYGDITFVQSNDTNDDTWVVREAMRIDKDGDVGIGGSPAGGIKLDVVGKVNVDERLTVDHSNSGSVWIGDNSSTSTDNRYVALYNDNGLRLQTRTDAGVFVSNDYLITTDATGATAHRWNIANSEKMRITSNGRVGIGTSDPSTDLDVAGGIRSTSSGGYNQITTTSIGDAVFNNNGNNWLTVKDGVPANAMRIDSAGRVGIGTSSPSDLLDLSSADPRIRLTNTGSGYALVRTGGSDASLILEADAGNTAANSDIIMRVDNDEKMRIDAAGRVGIGTGSPIYTFDVLCTSGSAWEVARIRNDTAGDGALLRFQHANSPTNGYDIGPTGSKDGFAFRRDGSEQMRIDSAGIVEIAEGSVTLNGNTINALQVTIADDAVAALTFNNRRGGLLWVLSSGSSIYPQVNNFSGFVPVDFGTSPTYTTPIFAGTSFAMNNNGALTGTTGTNGFVTVGTAGTAGTLYVENRTGGSKNFQITLL